MAFPSSQLPALWLKPQLAASAPGPKEQICSPLLVREVCMSAEQAQGKQQKLPSIILEIFHLFWEK